MSAPLLAADGLRVDENGTAVVDGVTFTTTGDRVLMLGAPRALIEAAAGLRFPAHGTLYVAGLPVVEALERGATAYVPLDPPLPLKWKVRRYVEESARLAGHGEAARARAVAALEALSLRPAAEMRVGALAVAAKRALVVAAALATDAVVVLLEDVFAGLPEDVARHLAVALNGALGDRRWLLFSGRVSLTSPLVERADDALVFDHGGLVGQGAPRALATRDRAFALRIAGDARGLARALRESGAEAEALAAHVVVHLAEGQTTNGLFAMATTRGCVILELRSLSRSFS